PGTSARAPRRESSSPADPHDADLATAGRSSAIKSCAWRTSAEYAVMAAPLHEPRPEAEFGSPAASCNRREGVHHGRVTWPLHALSAAERGHPRDREAASGIGVVECRDQPPPPE